MRGAVPSRLSDQKKQVIVAGERPSDRSALVLFLNKTHPFSFEGEERGEMAHCVFYDFFCLYFCALGINWYYEYVQQLI